MRRINDIRIRFGETVRSARTARGLSQEEFAHLSGLDRSYIGGVERGERNPSIVAIDQIARGLRISIADLFGELLTKYPESTKDVDN
jgi:transcriptional regulator with XRE-family HTH domain